MFGSNNLFSKPANGGNMFNNNNAQPVQNNAGGVGLFGNNNQGQTQANPFRNNANTQAQGQNNMFGGNVQSNSAPAFGTNNNFLNNNAAQQAQGQGTLSFGTGNNNMFANQGNKSLITGGQGSAPAFGGGNGVMIGGNTNAGTAAFFGNAGNAGNNTGAVFGSSNTPNAFNKTGTQNNLFTMPNTQANTGGNAFFGNNSTQPNNSFMNNNQQQGGGLGAMFNNNTQTQGGIGMGNNPMGTQAGNNMFGANKTNNFFNNNNQNSAGNSFGANNLFANNQNNQNPMFGGNNQAFNPSNPQNLPEFGSKPQNTPAFGTNTGNSLGFGNNANNAAFGNNANTGFNALGNNNTATNNMFSNSTPNQNFNFGNNTTNSFNQTNQTPTGNNMFGNTSWGVPTNNFSTPAKFVPLKPKNTKIDGKHVVKCITLLDQNTNFCKKELWMRYIMTGGSSNPQPQQGFAQQNNLFGAGGASNGMAAGTNLNFGSAAPAFGTNNAVGGNSGGNFLNLNTPATTGGFAFGNNNNQTGGFMNNNNNANNGLNTAGNNGFTFNKPGNNLFANNTNTAVPLAGNPTGNMFNTAGNTTGNMFNNTAGNGTGNMFNNTQSPTTTGFSFGNKPTGGGLLFGNSPQPNTGGNMFANNTGFANNNTAGQGLGLGGGGGGGLLFGNKPQTPMSNGLTPNTGFTMGQPTTNGNMFGPKPASGGMFNFNTAPAGNNMSNGTNGMNFSFSQQTPSGTLQPGGINNNFGNRQGYPYNPQDQNLKMIQQFYKSLFDSEFFKTFQKSTPFDKLKQQVSKKKLDYDTVFGKYEKDQKKDHQFKSSSNVRKQMLNSTINFRHNPYLYTDYNNDQTRIQNPRKINELKFRMNQSMIDLKPATKAAPSSLIPSNYANKIAQSNIRPGSMLKKSDIYRDEDQLPSTEKNYKITPDVKHLKRKSVQELKRVSNVIIQNQYGKIIFKEPIDLYYKKIDQCVAIQPNQIQIKDQDWDKKKCELVFYNFGEYAKIEKKQEKEKVEKKIKKWVDKNNMRLIEFDDFSGNLHIEVLKY